MKTIQVTASKNYDVLIGYGLLDHIGDYLTPLMNNRCKIAIISDSNVWPLYGKAVCEILSGNEFDVFDFVFPAGESSKTAETYLQILNFLAENKFTRSDAILALGGGVVGDMSGFVAATFLRGVRYIQVPTSLLAMVDSSVGGKTAIDLPAGKNLVGAFYQPSLVVCDLALLASLPESVFCDGCAEVIKYGVLYDQALFDHLRSFGLSFDREYVVSRCVSLKRDVVADDEFDTGARQKLNLGHTIGHGIEKQSNFTITHGQAVAIGMAIVSKAGVRSGFCDASVANDIISILNQFNLPFQTGFSAEQLYCSALSDKKRSGGTVNLIIPQTIGSCIIKTIPVSELMTFIEEGL